MRQGLGEPGTRVDRDFGGRDLRVNRGTVLVDLRIEVVVIIRMTSDRRTVLVDLWIEMVVVDVCGGRVEHDRARLVVMVRREVTVHRDVHPRHDLEARDPYAAEHQRESRSRSPGSRRPGTAHRVLHITERHPHARMYDLVHLPDRGRDGL